MLANAPLLFVHGAWHGAWCWEEYFVPYFEKQGHRVRCVELPRHGRLADPGQRLRWLSARDYVAAVCSSADQLREESGQAPVLVGHSMGGYVVQKTLELSSDSPDDFAGMILLASVPPTGVLRTTLSIARHYPLQFLEVLATLRLYPLVRRREHSRGHFFSADIPADRLERYHGLIGDESFRALLDMLLLDLPKPRRVPKLPALVLGAADDHVFTPREVQATARSYGADSKIFAGMAHDMMLEAGWQSVADRMLAWLKSG